MDISISGKDYKTKFNIGDKVYEVIPKQKIFLCSKCNGNGYYHKDKMSYEVTTCSCCHGNGLKYGDKFVIDTNPFIIKKVSLIIADDGLKIQYLAEGKDNIFGGEVADFKNEDRLFVTIEEAEKYCAEQNTIKKTLKLADIIIQPSYLQTYPNSSKIKERMDELKKHGKFTNMIEVDINNVLVDGYTTYVLAKGFGFEEIEVIVREDVCV